MRCTISQRITLTTHKVFHLGFLIFFNNNDNNTTIKKIIIIKWNIKFKVFCGAEYTYLNCNQPQSFFAYK